ncbi:MAG: type II secretion system protein [Phycisphaerales bacterium]
MLPRRPATPTRAVTLLEVIVAVAVLGILLALLVPIAAHARRGGEHAEELVTIRNYGVALVAYENDHRGQLPFAGEPGRPEAGIHFRVRGETVGTGPNGSAAVILNSFLWASAIVPYLDTWQGLPWNVRLFPSPIFDDGEAVGAFQSPVWMTFADPALWQNENPSTYKRSTFRPQNVAQSRHPERKILLTAIGARREDGRLPIVTIDRSVRVLHPDEILPTLEVASPLFPFSIHPWPGSATVNGLLGYDFIN